MKPLGDRTWPDIREDPKPTLLVPLGSLEQHGPHLPLSTDSIIAQAWADGLASSLSVPVAVAPLLPYGASGEHQHFEGTISIGTDALHHVLVELVRSASAHFPLVVFVSGHGGNADALERAARQLRDEGRRAEYLLPWLDGADAHAGHTETSLLLHLAPERVQLERAQAGRTEPLSELMDDMRIGGVAAVSPNGVLGNPDGASADVGASMLEILITNGVRAIERMLLSP